MNRLLQGCPPVTFGALNWLWAVNNSEAQNGAVFARSKTLGNIQGGGDSGKGRSYLEDQEHGDTGYMGAQI